MYWESLEELCAIGSNAKLRIQDVLFPHIQNLSGFGIWTSLSADF